jgi:23S rRNA pseudouridine1911/1915/1917 synthase
MIILFEDNHLLVLDKPAGLPTQITAGKNDSLEERAKAWLKDKYKKPGKVFLHAVHRLDTPVSGVVVFAKTSKALQRLQETMRTGSTKKTYHAWVEGIVEKQQGTFEHWLIHGEGRALEGSKADPKAKKCVLHYKILQKTKDKTLVEIALQTGRYHQIRAQWSLVGHPIWGDRKYGSTSTYPYEGIALQHVSFSIPHPVKGELMVFASPAHLLTLF